MSERHINLIDNYAIIGISQISVWEVAKLVEKNRLKFTISVKEWLETALSKVKLQIIPLDTTIIVNSTQLRDDFHKDPADQLIVATARVLDIPLLTEDEKILAYPHYLKSE